MDHTLPMLAPYFSEHVHTSSQHKSTDIMKLTFIRDPNKSDILVDEKCYVRLGACSKQTILCILKNLVHLPTQWAFLRYPLIKQYFAILISAFLTSRYVT